MPTGVCYKWNRRTAKSRREVVEQMLGVLSQLKWRGTAPFRRNARPEEFWKQFHLFTE